MIVQRLKQCDELGTNADPKFNTYFASESRGHDLLACRWHNVTNWNRLFRHVEHIKRQTLGTAVSQMLYPDTASSWRAYAMNIYHITYTEQSHKNYDWHPRNIRYFMQCYTTCQLTSIM